MRSVEARLRKFRAARTMKDKLSELKDRIAKVQTIQRSANEMRESENDPNSQIKETVGSERFSGLDFLRAFALLMGVLLHALSMYLEPADGSEPKPIAGIICLDTYLAHAIIYAPSRVLHCTQFEETNFMGIHAKPLDQTKCPLLNFVDCYSCC